ncbi:MAG TPA: tRNA (adenosine(37)-N6)-threonylcarbamoyltransferase complex ATPase subunit type 1 TsaE [Candidatus Paceibacterota bacterium]|jgi:tRNA threonylcarbamoyladenosine biosynthesis protein TsaE|nr:tRNA (adenosine(37)-N6)-threonylcarbamoyltransferase complex ATPase subunit type 1 TsaE [Candidatus Paceibacterota bacterium]
MEKGYTEDQIETIAEEVLQVLTPSDTGATVLALQGDLGAGKTTLTKALSKKLGVAETVISPTFVIAKFYDPVDSPFDQLVHIDAYRIESNDELKPLGWENILAQPKTLVIVEWPERIREALPSDRYHFFISHDGDQRTIKKM